MCRVCGPVDDTIGVSGTFLRPTLYQLSILIPEATYEVEDCSDVSDWGDGAQEENGEEEEQEVDEPVSPDGYDAMPDDAVVLLVSAKQR